MTAAVGWGLAARVTGGTVTRRSGTGLEVWVPNRERERESQFVAFRSGVRSGQVRSVRFPAWRLEVDPGSWPRDIHLWVKFQCSERGRKGGPDRDTALLA